MPLKIDIKRCTSCGICMDRCPMDIIRLNEEGIPFQLYDECWSCGVCEEDCPEKALTLILPYLVR